MNPIQRAALEQEIRLHRARLEQLDASLQDAEENLRQVVDAPASVLGQVDALKIELRGRKAAIALGCAVLEAHTA